MSKQTAEQKLLKLIELTDAQQGQQAAETTPASAPATSTEAQEALQSVTGVGFSGLALPPVLVQALSFFQGLVGPKGKGFGLREFNHLFTLAVIVFVVFFVLDLTRGIEESKRQIRSVVREASAGRKGAHGGVWQPLLKPVGEYLQLIKERNIFQPYEVKLAVETEKTPEEKMGIQQISDRVKDLKLVGISWLDSPETASVMVENVTTGTTFFLGEGDTINNVMVRRIFADSVVMSYDNQEMELKL